MPKLTIDLTGQKFGSLTALEHIGYGRWKCRCDCGNIAYRWNHNLKRNCNSSCGCRSGRPITSPKNYDCAWKDVIREYANEFPSLKKAIENVGLKGDSYYCSMLKRIRKKTGLEIRKFEDFIQLGELVGLEQGHTVYNFAPTEKYILYSYLTERKHCVAIKTLHWGNYRYTEYFARLCMKYDLTLDSFGELTSIWNCVQDAVPISDPGKPGRPRKEDKENENKDVVIQAAPKCKRDGGGDISSSWSYSAPYERSSAHQPS